MVATAVKWVLKRLSLKHFSTFGYFVCSGLRNAVWALATKRDPATQLDLCEQRSKTTLEGTVAHILFPTVATKYLARPLSRRRIQTVRPPYEKVQVPSRIFPVDTGSAGGILLVGITAIRSEGQKGWEHSVILVAATG